MWLSKIMPWTCRFLDLMAFKLGNDSKVYNYSHKDSRIISANTMSDVGGGAGGKSGTGFWSSQSPLLNTVVPTRRYLLILLFLSMSYTIWCVYIQTYKTLGPFFQTITDIVPIKWQQYSCLNKTSKMTMSVNLDMGKFTRPHHSWRAIYRHGKTVFFRYVSPNWLSSP